MNEIEDNILENINILLKKWEEERINKWEKK
jgi:hypothetical protein